MNNLIINWKVFFLLLTLSHWPNLSYGGEPKEIYFKQSVFDFSYVKTNRILNGHPGTYKSRKAKRILFLGDKDTIFNFSKASKLAPYFAHIPDSEIYKTDIGISDEEAGQFGNLRVQKLDNTKAFPFPDQYFDMVIMRNGICHCEAGERSCGGIILKEQEMAAFFNEVVRILNNDNPQSMALLTGKIPLENPVVTPIKTAAREIAETHRHLQIDLLHEKGKTLYHPDRPDNFMGVRIQPKNSSTGPHNSFALLWNKVKIFWP